MPFQSSDSLVRLFKLCARAAGFVVTLLGIAVLVAWALGADAVYSVLHGLFSVQVNTALGFVFSGVSLGLIAANPGPGRKRSIARIAAVAALLIGLLSLSESWLHWNLHIDELLFKDTSGNPFPGRMVPATALRFLLVGLALLATDIETRGKRRPTEWLALIVAAISMLALVGYVYGVRSIYGIPGAMKLSWETALGFMVLAVGLLLSRPEAGFIDRKSVV